MTGFDYGAEPQNYAAVALLLLYLFAMVIMTFSLIVTFVNYILQGFSLLRISKKLGLPNGWMAFVPYANRVLLGRIAEESDERAYPDEEPKKWSTIYLVLSILYSLFVPVISGVSASLAIFANFVEDSDPVVSLLSGFAIPAGVILLVLTIPTLVVRYMILFRVYRVMAGKRAAGLTVLSIFVPEAVTVTLAVLGLGRRQPRYPAVSYETLPDEAPVEAPAGNE